MTRARTLAARSLLPVLAVLAVGCHSAFTTAAPKGFVELDESSRYDFRAIDPDGLVIAVRELDNDPQATLEFWTRAAENAMRERGGYALLESRDVQVAGGLRGKQLRFGHDEASRPHLYDLTLVVTCGAIYVLEAGGDKALVERHRGELDAWLRGFRAERCAPWPFSFACTAAGSGGAAAPAASTKK